MKKNFILFLTIGVIIFLLLTITCDQNPFFGVGEEVDTQDPSINVTLPISGSYVKGSFLLNGTCKD
ncbi:MAG: hypothetical protein KAT05_06570, partial [Spirochaetes bacterium]|nr:hypothetical protein [Spirochaetota bacterium]